MNAEGRKDSDPAKDPLRELVDSAADKTTAAVYAAFQGEGMQFGPTVFHNITNITRRYPNSGLSIALDYFAAGLPHYMATSVFGFGSPVPYHLYGVFFRDLPEGVTTIVTGGNISWEKGPPSYEPKGVPSGRTSTPTAICMQLQDTGSITDKFISSLRNQPTDILYKYLKHQIFAKSWLIYSPTGSSYNDNYKRSTTTGYFKLEVDGVHFKELHSPFQFSPTGIRIPRS